MGPHVDEIEWYDKAQAEAEKLAAEKGQRVEQTNVHANMGIVFAGEATASEPAPVPAVAAAPQPTAAAANELD